MSGRTQHANAAFLLRVQKERTCHFFSIARKEVAKEKCSKGEGQIFVPPLVQSPPRTALTLAPSRAYGGNDCTVLCKTDCIAAATS